MDKVLYRLILWLVCIALAIFLILAPILADMYVKMERRETNMEKREKRMKDIETRIDKKIEKLEHLKGE
jgi:type II secretory pathway component PulJ